jgi:hypothetical protein
MRLARRASAVGDRFQNAFEFRRTLQLDQLVEVSPQIVFIEVGQKIRPGRGIELADPLDHIVFGHFRLA